MSWHKVISDLKYVMCNMYVVTQRQEGKKCSNVLQRFLRMVKLWIFFYLSALGFSTFFKSLTKIILYAIRKTCQWHTCIYVHMYVYTLTHIYFLLTTLLLTSPASVMSSLLPRLSSPIATHRNFSLSP